MAKTTIKLNKQSDYPGLQAAYAATVDEAISAVQSDVDDNKGTSDAAEAALAGRLDVVEGDGEGSINAAVAGEAARAGDAEAAIQAALDVQEAKQESERAAMDAAYKAADSALSSSVASRMATDEARMDAVLLAADADKDSFAEIVSLINSVDTENDDALAAYVLSNNNAVADLQGELDTQEAKQESERAAMDAAYKAADVTLQSNIDSVASDLSDYETSNDAALATEVTDRENAVANEATLRSGSIATLNGSLLDISGSIVADFAAADAATTAVINNYIASNDAALAAEIAATNADFSAASDARGDIQADVDANQAAIEAALAAEVAATDADFVAATAARTALSESIESTMASNASTAADATAAVASDLASYETSNDAALAVETGRIDAILDASEADKDSFAEIVTLINSVDTENDEAFAGYVASNNAALAAEIASTDADFSAASEARDAIQSALDVQEAKQESERAAMDAAYKAADAAEAIAREEADTALDAAYKAADAALTENLEVETARATEAEEANAAAIAAEQARAEAAEEVLTTNVASLLANSDEAMADSIKEVVDGHNAAMSIVKTIYAKKQSQTLQPDGEATEFMFDKALMAGSATIYFNGVTLEEGIDFTMMGEDGSPALGFMWTRSLEDGDIEVPAEGERLMVYGILSDLANIAVMEGPEG